jgi:uncharacterized membrane protein HdeD (DUF308 family)
MRRFAWWFQLLIGVACVAIGIALTMRSFTSLGVLVVFVAVSFVATGVSGLASTKRIAPAAASGG